MNAPVRPARWRWRLLALLLLALGAGGFAALNVFKPRPAIKTPARQLPLVRTVVLEARTGTLSVTGQGVVRPRTEVVLAAEVAGRVVAMSPALVDGARFARGEVLLRLDPEPFRAALAQASAELASARAVLAVAEQSLARTRKLIADGFLSPQTLDERTAARDQAQAALERVQALQRQRQLELERSVLHAPFAGRVLSERVDVGETVQPGKELARIYADDALEVPVSLADRDMALVPGAWLARAGAPRDVGTPAQVIVAHGAGRYRWPGRVTRVESAVDAATRTFTVVVRVDEPARRGEPLAGAGEAAPPLLVGMYASVEIAGVDPGPHALLPSRALRAGGTLWLADAQDRIAVRPVRVLRDQGGLAAVALDGLPPGARVVVSDLAVVMPGMPVRVTAADRAGPDATAPAAGPATR